MIPFFQPLLIPHDDETWYLAEDYSFSERVRRCGIQIFADTTVRLKHLGLYGYSWEDAGSQLPRSDNFTLTFPPDKPR